MPPFEYRQAPNPYAASISDLLLRQGDIQAQRATQVGNAQAQAAQARGQIWGAAAQQIGQAAGNAITQHAEEQKQAPIRAQEQQIRDLTISGAKTDAATKQAALEVNKTIDGLMKGSLITDPTTGATTYDRQKLQQGFASSGIGHLWPQYSELLDKSDASLKTLRETHHTAIVDVARLVDAAGNDATVFMNELARGVKNGLFTEAESAPIVAAVQRDPAHIARLTASLLGKKTDLVESDPRKDLRDPITNEIVRAGTPDPDKVADNLRADAQVAETARHNRATESQAASSADAGVLSLTPEGLDAAAMMFAKTGQLPAMGMGKASGTVRTQIINRAAQLMPGLDIASNKADFTANQGALTQIQKQRDAIGAFEQTAMKNIDVFLKTAEKVVDTGSPLANTLVRQASGKLLGSSDQASYDAARQVAINEIAKITSNPNLSGSLSDSARHEVDAFNPQNATLKQTVAVMRILKQDMQNRTQALDQQLGAIRGRIKGGSSDTGQGGPKVGDTVTVAGGKRIKITALHADGTFDGDPVQ